MLYEIITSMITMEKEGIDSIHDFESKLANLVPVLSSPFSFSPSHLHLQDKIRRDTYLRDLRKGDNGKFHWRMNLQVLQVVF
jgi:hypothetical protein